MTLSGMEKITRKFLCHFAVSHMCILRSCEISKRFISKSSPPRLEAISPIFSITNAFKSTGIISMFYAVKIVLEFCSGANIFFKIMNSTSVPVINESIMPENETVHKQSHPFMGRYSITASVAPWKMFYFLNIFHIYNGVESLCKWYISNARADWYFNWSRFVFMNIVSAGHVSL